MNGGDSRPFVVAVYMGRSMASRRQDDDDDDCGLYRFISVYNIRVKSTYLVTKL